MESFDEFISQLKKDVLNLNDSYRDSYINKIESLYPKLKTIGSNNETNDNSDNNLTVDQQVFLSSMHYQFKFRKDPLDFAFCLTVNDIIINNLKFS